jgi:autotransporter-associated beta strand protein
VFLLGINASATSTSAAITGDGALVIQGRAAGKDFLTQNTNTSGSDPSLTLDMSGLASFTADVDQFNVAHGSGQNNFTFLFADSNTVTANTMRFGNNTTPNPSGTVEFGQTNVFNSDTIVIGGARHSVTADFRSGLTGTPTLKIRGTGGTDADLATLVVGINDNRFGASNGGSSYTNSFLDTTAGSVDFRLDQFVIGAGGSVASNTYGIGRGTFIFDEGSVVANDVTIALASDASTGVTGNRGGNHGSIDMRGGTLTAGSLSIARNEDGDTGLNAVIRGNFLVSGGVATITGDVAVAEHTAASPSTGASEGTVVISGGTLNVGGNITRGQDGGNNVATVTLSGGTLDLMGGSFIDINFLSLNTGTLRNVAEINGGAGLSKNAPGTLILEGVNTYTGGTSIASGDLQLGSGGTSGTFGSGDVSIFGGSSVQFNRSDRIEVPNNITGGGDINQIGSGRTILSGTNTFTGSATVTAGELTVANPNGLQGATSVSVLGGATLSYLPGSTSTLTLAPTSGTALTLADSSSVGVEVGGTIALQAGAMASTTGTIGLNLVGNPVDTPASGNYTLLSSPSGGLNGGTYDFSVFNATNFTATLNPVTANDVSVALTSVPGGLPAAFWLGGQVASAGGVWAQSGAGGSNWASDATGTSTGLVPGPSTDVTISVNAGAAQQNAMSLGAPMSIQSLTVNNTYPVTLSDAVNTLTISASGAITVSSGAGLTTLDSRLELTDAAPVIEVDSANGLVISGELTGNAPTKTGPGDLTISGSSLNIYTGNLMVNEGAVLLNKSGVSAIAAGAVVGDGTGTDTLRLLAANQIADSADLTLNSSGVLDLNDQSETLDGLNGSGLVTNSGTAAIGLTLGAGNDGAASFSGVIEDGTGTTGLTKVGTGTQTLSGMNTFSGGTTISSGTLALGGSDVLVGPVTVEGASAIFDLGTGNTDSVDQVTLRNGGTIAGGVGSVLSSSVNFAAEDGTISGTLGGASQLVKTTTGTLTISGPQSYTGASNFIEGDVVLAAGGALPMTSLIVGDGRDATFTAQADSSLSIGSGSSDSFYVGVRVANTNLDRSDSTMDISALNDFTANVGDVQIGVNIGGGNGNNGIDGGGTGGSVFLATNNTITATDRIILGKSRSNGNGLQSDLTFGSGTNTVTTPTFIIGGEKSIATVTIGAGGTLILGNGQTGTNLTLGFNGQIGTGTTARGTLNLTGGTVVANLGTFVLGDKNGGGTSGRAEGFFTSGTSADNSLRATTIIVGDLSGGTTANARGTGVLNWNGGLLQADSIVLGRFGTGSGQAQGTLNLNRGIASFGSDLTDGGGANAVTEVNLAGAILDMNGNAIGSGSSPIDTLTFQSGTLRNVSEINTNTHTGTTNVNGGRLWVQGGNAMGGSTSVAVANGATFDYAPGAGEVLNLSSLNLADGSSIGAEAKNGSIVVGGAATTTGNIMVNVFGIAGQPTPTGAYDIVTATSGLDGGTYTLGNLYNATNFTVSGVSGDAGSITVNLTATAELATAYWKGGFAGATNEWAVTNGTSSSNWTTDAAGTVDTPLIPGVTTDVMFSATGASSQGATILGANMSVGSLTFSDASAVGLNDLANSLTVNKANAITVANGAGPVSLTTNLSFANAAAVIDVDGGSSGLQLGGILGGSNGFTKTGAGTLTFIGASSNTTTGTVTVHEGLVELSKNVGSDAISGDLVIGDGSGTDTVRLLNADQIGNSGTTTINAGGVLDLNGLNESMGGLAGTGTVTSGAAGTLTFSIGAGGQNASFGGTIENGSGTVSLAKTGAGTQTITSAQPYTGGTHVLGGTLAIGGSDLLIGDLNVDGGTAVFDVGANNETFDNVTLAGGGSLNGSGTVTSLADFDLQSGTVNAVLGGGVGLNKTTAGTVTLNSTGHTFTGNVQISGGTLAVGANDAIPTDRDVILGSGTQTGTLDLSNASQTLNGLLIQSDVNSNNNVIVGAGQTLTVNGTTGFQVGIFDTVSADSRATFSGGGSLVVETPSLDFDVGLRTEDGSPSNRTPSNRGELDLSGLAHFSANVDDFRAGFADEVCSIVNLANSSNVIIANDIHVGDSAGRNGQQGELHLGSGSNVLQANRIEIGTSKVRGILDFQGSGGTLDLTGRNGGEINIIVGSTDGTGTGATPFGTLDLRNGTANVRANQLIIGQRNGSLTGGARGEVFFESGTFTANRVRIAEKTNVSANVARGELNISGGSFVVGNGGFTLGSQADAGTSEGTVNLTGGTLVSDSSILDLGGASTTTFNVQGGTLDLMGNTLGDGTNPIDNLNLESGGLRNVAEINGGAGLTKTGTGLLVLGGTNSFSGGVAVNSGTLQVAQIPAMPNASDVTVSSGGRFQFADGVGGTLNIDNLNLANGSAIGAEVGGGGGIVVNPANAASATGTVSVDVFGIPGFAYVDGTFDLVTAVGGGLNGASYTVGNYYNVTNFTVNSAGVDTDSVFVNISTSAELPTAYWKGGFAGATNVWTVSDGTTQSNWTTDMAGTLATPQTPGSITDVMFCATGATNQASTVLGANMSIGSLTIDDATPVLTIDGASHSLTINKPAAITISNTSGAVVMNTQLALTDATPVLDVDNASLAINGAISGNAFTKTGGGTLTLSGVSANTGTGTTTVNGGTLVLLKDTGVNAIDGDLVIGDGIGTDTVKLGNDGQLADGAVVTVNSGGVFDLAGNGEGFGMIQGAGLITSSIAGNGTMNLGNANGSGNFSGVIEDGSGTVGIVKNGTGTLTLSGTSANTLSGDITLNRGVIDLSKPDNVQALGSSTIRINSNGVAASVLQLSADNQLRPDVDVRINAGGGVNARLDLGGNDQTVGSLDLITITFGGATVATGAGGTLTVNGDISLNHNRGAAGNSARFVLITGTGTPGSAAPNSGTLNLGGATRTITTASSVTQDNTDAVIETVITNGGITKEGTETLYLTGDNTYDGITSVMTGSLVMTGSHTGGGNYSVASGATLAGNGTMTLAPNANFEIGGLVDVGDPGATTQTASKLSFIPAGTGATTFNDGSTLTLALLSGAGLGDNSGNASAADMFGLTGSLDLLGTVTLNVQNPNSMTGWAENDRWKIFDWAGLNLTGAFDLNLPDISATGLFWDDSDLYVGGTLAIAIPEPSRMMLVWIGAALAVLRRRRS